MIVTLIIMMALFIGYTLLFYFGVPLLFGYSLNTMLWFFFITFALVNASALISSWLYFERTRCYEDEGNPLAMLLYYLFGHDAAHVVLAVFRWLGAIGFYFTVFGLDVVVLGIHLVIPSQDYLLMSIPIAIFATELTFNLYALSTNWDKKCEPVRPLYCLNPDGCGEL